MTIHSEATIDVKSWDEDTYADQGDDGKLTQADVEYTYAGDVEGEGTERFLTCHRPDGTAVFVGFQRLEATIDGRSGAFTVQAVGGYDGSVAASEWTIVTGSGTGELSGISGTGSFRAGGPQGGLTLDHELG